MDQAPTSKAAVEGKSTACADEWGPINGTLAVGCIYLDLTAAIDDENQTRRIKCLACATPLGTAAGPSGGRLESAPDGDAGNLAGGHARVLLQ